MVDPAAVFDHTPVMRDEIVELLSPAPAGVVVDATLGGAGHASALLSAHSGITIHGFDQDPVARNAAAKKLESMADRVVIHSDRFDRCRIALADAGVESISGFLMDLGVSSPQLDVAERGFSYQHSGPLDMRMDPSASTTAAMVVNEYPVEELLDVLRAYGDERHAQRIARAIVASRPLSTTTDLAKVIVEAVPAAARRQPGHPAKRSFQAIRIEVNDELGILASAVNDLIDLLVPGGIGLVLTYHSGEDKLVKGQMRLAVEADDLPGMPRRSEFEWLFRGARTSGVQEVTLNPRSRSARLRGIRRKDRNGMDT